MGDVGYVCTCVHACICVVVVVCVCGGGGGGGAGGRGVARGGALIEDLAQVLKVIDRQGRLC